MSRSVRRRCTHRVHRNTSDHLLSYHRQHRVVLPAENLRLREQASYRRDSKDLSRGCSRAPKHSSHADTVFGGSHLTATAKEKERSREMNGQGSVSLGDAEPNRAGHRNCQRDYRRTDGHAIDGRCSFVGEREEGEKRVNTRHTQSANLSQRAGRDIVPARKLDGFWFCLKRRQELKQKAILL